MLYRIIQISQSSANQQCWHICLQTRIIAYRLLLAWSPLTQTSGMPLWFIARIDCPLIKQCVSGRYVTTLWNGIPRMFLEEFLLWVLKSLMQFIWKIKHFVWAQRISRSVLVLSGANAMRWIPTRHVSMVCICRPFSFKNVRCKHFKKVDEIYPSLCSFHPFVNWNTERALMS